MSTQSSRSKIIIIIIINIIIIIIIITISWHRMRSKQFTLAQADQGHFIFEFFMEESPSARMLVFKGPSV